MNMSKAAARRAVEKYANHTGYFDGSISYAFMYRMFRDMQFGEAETKVILAALIQAGAKFR